MVCVLRSISIVLSKSHSKDNRYNPGSNKFYGQRSGHAAVGAVTLHAFGIVNSKLSGGFIELHHRPRYKDDRQYHNAKDYQTVLRVIPVKQRQLVGDLGAGIGRPLPNFID